ncbi:oligosaccharide flippase family protein [Vibrio sp.]|nr:oligosaccharide flippase family protein [Vibrio sp.]
MSAKSKKIVKASLLLLIVSWYSRILSTISIIILARNLDKEDFGILAGCFIVQGFFNVLSNVGAEHYLLRKETISSHDINSAWTIGFLTKSLMALLIFICSDLAANYMGIPEMSNVLKVMSLSSLFIGLQNPAINLKVKQLDYSKVSLIEIISKSVSSTVSIVIAIMYQTYWAVVVGSVLYNFLYSLGSHFIVKHKIKFERQNLALQWEFSKWILLKGIISYIKYSSDKVIVGRSFSVGQLGLYNFAMESASTAFQFIIMPLNKIIYPSLSEYINDRSLLVDKINKSILVLCSVYMPIIFGGAFLSDMIVPIIFGDKWIEAIPLFQVFLVMTLSRMLTSVLTDIFTLTGHVKKQFIFELVTSVIFLSIIYFCSSLGLEEFSVVRALCAYLMLFLIIVTLYGLIGLSLFRIIFLLVPIVILSSVMVFSIFMLKGFINTGISPLDLIIYIFSGFFVYLLSFVVSIFFLKDRVNEYSFLYKTFYLPVFNLIMRKVKRV